MAPLTSTEAFLVDDFENRFYLTGFSGSDGLVVVTAAQIYLLVDSRYFIQAEKGSFPTIQVIRLETSFLDSLRALLAGLHITHLYFEPTQLRVAMHTFLKKGLPSKLVPKRGFVVEQRALKTAVEIEKLGQAQALTDETFGFILNELSPGQTELEVAWLLERFIRERGGSTAWEPFIVGFGDNTASPHHSPTDRTLTAGDLIQFDFGAKVDGYCSDLSRVVFTAEPTEMQRELYRHLWAAQRLGMDLIKPKQLSSAVDEHVRNFLQTHISEGTYQHSLGHGIGLEVHEKPALSIRSKDTLKEGMVVTVEPGIYKEGWGGMRLEDVLVVTSAGHDTLTSAPKEIQAITRVL